MTPLVIDASVAAKWVLPVEPLSAVAAVLQQRHLRREIQAIVPDLFWPGMTNFFWISVKRGRMSKEKAEADLADLQQLEMTTMPAAPLCDQALQ